MKRTSQFKTQYKLKLIIRQGQVKFQFFLRWLVSSQYQRVWSERLTSAVKSHSITAECDRNSLWIKQRISCELYEAKNKCKSKNTNLLQKSVLGSVKWVLQITSWKSWLCHVSQEYMIKMMSSHNNTAMTIKCSIHVLKSLLWSELCTAIDKGCSENSCKKNQKLDTLQVCACKWSLQKRCKHYPKVHGQTKADGHSINVNLKQ